MHNSCNIYSIDREHTREWPSNIVREKKMLLLPQKPQTSLSLARYLCVKRARRSRLAHKVIYLRQNDRLLVDFQYFFLLCRSLVCGFWLKCFFFILLLLVKLLQQLSQNSSHLYSRSHVLGSPKKKKT